MKNTFQKTLVAFAFLLVANFVMAQAPQGIPYQAVARDNAGNLIKNQPITLRFKIHDGTANGAVVYSETHSVTTDALGLFAVKIGGGTSSGTFANINWGSGAKFTQVALDVTGGSNFIDMGTTQMMSVPYALYAGSSATSTTTIGPIGATAAVNGATISSGVLSLTPADATNGGIVTTGAQTIAGAKSFSSDVIINGTPFGTKGTPGNVAIGTNAGQTTQGLNAVAMGTNAGVTSQGKRALAMGEQAGQTTQSAQAVAIGFNAGQNNQGYGSVAIGSFAGQINQTNTSVAIGFDAGAVNQNANAVAIGYGAGSFNQNSVGVAIGNNTGHAYQGFSSVAIGNSSAQNNQSDYAIAMGYTAGQTNQGTNAIAIGNAAGTSNQAANSIILNASGVDLNNANNGLFIAPIRDAASTNVLSYDPITKEITYSTDAVGLQGPTGATGPQGPAGATGSVGSVTAIAGTSNANGATISDGNLTLTPADATNGGIVTNGAQTFAGNKTFTGTATANSFVKTGGTASQYLMADGSVSTGQSVLFNPTNPPTNGMVVYKYFQNNRVTTLYDDGKIRIRLNLGSNKLYLTNLSSNLTNIWSSVGSLRSSSGTSMDMALTTSYFQNFGTSVAAVGTEVNVYSNLTTTNSYVMSMNISAPDSPSFGLYVINFYFNTPLTPDRYSSMTVNYYKDPSATP